MNSTAWGSVASHQRPRIFSNWGRVFSKRPLLRGLICTSKILTEPTFPEVDVVREQADQLRDIDTLKEQRFHFCDEHFLAAFYGSHPYNHLAIGTRAGLTAVTRDDLAALHEWLARPEQAVYVVVGDITAEEVLALWERHAPEALAASDAAPAVAVPALPVWSEMVTRVVEMEGQQTHIIWGFPTVTGCHPDRYALHILDAILGGSGGRLFTELRDQKSLAYAVTSFRPIRFDLGFFWPGRLVAVTKSSRP